MVVKKCGEGYVLHILRIYVRSLGLLLPGTPGSFLVLQTWSPRFLGLDTATMRDRCGNSFLRLAAKVLLIVACFMPLLGWCGRASGRRLDLYRFLGLLILSWWHAWLLASFIAEVVEPLSVASMKSGVSTCLE